MAGAAASPASRVAVAAAAEQRARSVVRVMTASFGVVVVVPRCAVRRRGHIESNPSDGRSEPLIFRIGRPYIGRRRICRGGRLEGWRFGPGWPIGRWRGGGGAARGPPRGGG